MAKAKTPHCIKEGRDMLRTVGQRGDKSAITVAEIIKVVKTFSVAN